MAALHSWRQAHTTAHVLDVRLRETLISVPHRHFKQPRSVLKILQVQRLKPLYPELRPEQLSSPKAWSRAQILRTWLWHVDGGLAGLVCKHHHASAGMCFTCLICRAFIITPHRHHAQAVHHVSAVSHHKERGTHDMTQAVHLIG